MQPCPECGVADDRRSTSSDVGSRVGRSDGGKAPSARPEEYVSILGRKCMK